jgi:hypothetical protein
MGVEIRAKQYLKSDYEPFPLYIIHKAKIWKKLQ